MSVPVVDARVRFLSYNVCTLPFGARVSRSRDYKDERLQALATRLADYDVVCLQELFGSISARRRRFLRAASAQAGLRYHVTAPQGWPRGRIADGGTAILSRHPLRDCRYEPFVATMGYDALSDKGVLHALVELDAERAAVHVFCTHLQSTHHKHPSPKVQRAAAVRHHQLGQVTRFAANVMRQTTWPAVLVGDLNVDARHQPAEYSAMMRRLAANNSVFRPMDLFAPLHHPATFGARRRGDGGNDDASRPAETHLTQPEWQGSDQCLDYVIVLQRDDAADTIENVSCVFRAPRVNEFVVATTSLPAPLSHLSDHFGVSAVAHIGKN